MFSHLVVATDGSPTAIRALKVALELAKSLTSYKLDVVCVLAETLDGASHVATADEAATALAVSREFAAAAHVEIETHAVVGAHPADAILAFAREVKADTIVAGTDGRTGLERVLLGSVCAEILRSSELPVLVVRTTSML